jgi:two-component sensor histidine kinase
MLARWSLRSRLVAVVTIALLPVLALAAWHAVDEQRTTEQRRGEAMVAAAELVASRHRELIEGSRRLLIGVCAADAVRLSANPDATPADINRCEAYLGQVVQMFPNEYSSALVTDSQGVVRCSNVPTAVGIGFADREIFRLVRETRKFAIGAQVASRVTPLTEIPTALPFIENGEFRGMCAIGISLRTLVDLVTPARIAHNIAVSLVDRAGASVGGNPEATRVLPVAARLAAAIVGGQTAFHDYGQDGQLYQVRMLPLASTSIFVVAAAPVAEGLPFLLANWGGFALVVLALGVALLAVWLGADRWCVQPLRYIREFADRVARGDDLTLEPKRPWGPELSSVAEGVKAMAAAIASREAELTAGLEQRDHMLREIHHRVKNNLQMISSLLNLQAGEIRSPRIRRFFGDAQNRVLTLSILHRHLYERSSWALVDFQQFISDLVRQISVGRRGPDRPQPRYHIRAPIMAVGPDIAIPIGLIVTEAVGSALNRTFDSGAALEVRIEAADKAGTVELTIEDNAATAAGGSRGPELRGGFGLTLIRGLAMQLGGEAQISTAEGGGMRVMVTFPMPQDQDGDA